jgi:hypothetical protein
MASHFGHSASFSVKRDGQSPSGPPRSVLESALIRHVKRGGAQWPIAAQSNAARLVGAGKR